MSPEENEESGPANDFVNTIERILYKK